MTLMIDFTDETKEVEEKQLKVIEELLNYAAKIEGVQNEAEVSLTFVDNRRIQEINREYRNKDVETDVISFAMEEMGDDEIEIVGVDMPLVLGDIIISVPQAKIQAEEFGHSLLRELGFLAVHGFLHLLGYDHETNEDEAIMFAKQKELLEAYGLKR